MDWENFEQRARKVVPQRTLKVGRCLIGVLNHHIPTESQLVEADFLWMVGHEVSPGFFLPTIATCSCQKPVAFELSMPDNPTNVENEQTNTFTESLDPEDSNDLL